jgi:hypothetical protein
MATRSRGGRPPDPRATGQVLTYKRKNGLTSWYLRVRAYGGRHRIKLGTELDGWTAARAKIELQNVLAKIQAGIWEPPLAQSADRKDPTFHEFATSWLTRRKPYVQGANVRALPLHAHASPAAEIRAAAAFPARLLRDRPVRRDEAARERGGARGSASRRSAARGEWGPEASAVEFDDQRDGRAIERDP